MSIMYLKKKIPLFYGGNHNNRTYHHGNIDRKKIIFIPNREWRVVQDKFSEFNEEEKPKNHSSKNSIYFGREMSVDGII